MESKVTTPSKLTQEQIKYFMDVLGIADDQITFCQRGGKHVQKGGAPIIVSQITNFLSGCKNNKVFPDIEEIINHYDIDKDQLSSESMPKPDDTKIDSLADLFENNTEIATKVLTNLSTTEDLKNLAITCRTINNTILTNLEFEDLNFERTLQPPTLHDIIKEPFTKVLIDILTLELKRFGKFKDKANGTYLFINLFPYMKTIYISTNKFNQTIRISKLNENYEMIEYCTITFNNESDKLSDNLQRLGNFILNHMTVYDFYSIVNKTYKIQTKEIDESYKLFEKISHRLYYRVINKLVIPEMEVVQKVNTQYYEFMDKIYENINSFDYEKNRKELFNIIPKASNTVQNQIEPSSSLPQTRTLYLTKPYIPTVYLEIILNIKEKYNYTRFSPVYFIDVLESFWKKNNLNQSNHTEPKNTKKIVKLFNWICYQTYKIEYHGSEFNNDQFETFKLMTKKTILNILDYHITTRPTSISQPGGSKMKKYTKTTKKVKWPYNKSSKYAIKSRTVWVNNKNVEFVKVKNDKNTFMYKKI